MAKNISRLESKLQEEDEFRAEAWRDIRRAIAKGIGLGAIASTLLVTITTIADKNAEHDEKTTYAAAKAAAAHDGFDLQGFEEYYHNKATVKLRIPSRLGEACMIKVEADVTRDKGAIVDVHDYDIKGYANARLVWVGLLADHHQELIGSPADVYVEDFDQLEAVAGGPQNDFCANLFNK
jgi:hypothetical protein